MQILVPVSVANSSVSNWKVEFVIIFQKANSCNSDSVSNYKLVVNCYYLLEVKQLKIKSGF